MRELATENSQKANRTCSSEVRTIVLTRRSWLMWNTMQLYMMLTCCVPSLSMELRIGIASLLVITVPMIPAHATRSQDLYYYSFFQVSDIAVVQTLQQTQERAPTEWLDLWLDLWLQLWHYDDTGSLQTSMWSYAFDCLLCFCLQ